MAKPTKIQNQERARRLLDANLSPRYRRLDWLERYVECTQYEGRVPFGSSCNVPLRDRAPSITYPVVYQAIESNNDLVLGEGRWPEITTFSSEDDRALDPEFGLNEDDSKVIDAVIKKAMRQSRLPAMAAEALASSQGCGTVATVFGIRRGRLTIEVLKAKWCVVEFADAHQSDVERLEVRYPYVEEYRDERTGQWAERCMLYRRVIDANADTVYVPQEATDDGVEPKWDDNVDTERTVVHGLGFCPVRWYKFNKRVAAANEIDGVAIHQGRFELIDSLNFGLSQKDRAAFYCGDPQLIEVGVADDIEPGQVGNQASAVVTNSGNYAITQGRRGTARRRGAGTVWRYPDKESKVAYLTIGADGLKALEDNCVDLRAKLQEALKVTFLTPETAKYAAEFSAKALKTLLKRQLAACDRIREEFGDQFLIPAVSMMLRIAFVKERERAGSVYLPGLAKAMPILERFERAVESAIKVEDDNVEPVKQWFDPHIDLIWGPYFEPDPQEENQIIEGAVKAYAGKVISRKTAVERLAGIFKINNPDEYVKAVEHEEAEAHEREVSLLHAMNKVATADTDDDDDDGSGETDESGGSGDASSGAPAKAKAGTRRRAARRDAESERVEG